MQNNQTSNSSSLIQQKNRTDIRSYCYAKIDIFLCLYSKSIMDEQHLIKTALEYGADNAAVVKTESIVLNPDFRAMCEANQCGLFGRCYMCPPDAGPIEELMARVRKYEKGLLYQTVSPLEDSFDFDGMAAARKNLTRLSQRLQKAFRTLLLGKTLHLSAGGCGLCESCAKEIEKPCRYPDLALSSLECYGVDVYNTARNAGMKYNNGTNTVTYFGIVLYSEKDNG